MATGGEYSPSELTALVYGTPADGELARQQLLELFLAYGSAQDRRGEPMSDHYAGQITQIFDAFPEFEQQTDEGKLPIPEGLDYTLLHHDTFGPIPFFIGENSVVAEPNEQARQGLFEVPHEPRQ